MFTTGVTMGLAEWIIDETWQYEILNLMKKNHRNMK